MVQFYTHFSRKYKKVGGCLLCEEELEIIMECRFCWRSNSLCGWNKGYKHLLGCNDPQSITVVSRSMGQQSLHVRG